MSTEIGEISWNDKIERYFAHTGERAGGLAWIHKRSEVIYSNKKTLIDLPVIVIGAVNGFVSVGSAQMFGGWAYAPIVIGLISLSVSVLNTVGSYFGWAKRSEGHRISAIQYSKLNRFLSIEMSLPRDERMSPHDLLKYTREAYDRLQEVSPSVPVSVLDEFRVRFAKYEVAKPEETNGLERIVVFEEPLWDKERRSPVGSAAVFRPLASALKTGEVRPNPLQQFGAAMTVREPSSLTISLPKSSGETPPSSPRVPLPTHPRPDTLPI